MRLVTTHLWPTDEPGHVARDECPCETACIATNGGGFLVIHGRWAKHVEIRDDQSIVVNGVVWEKIQEQFKTRIYEPPVV